MNIKNILTSLGLDDGQGNISSSRIFMVIIALAVVVPKVVQACKTGVPPTWTADDFAMLGIGGGVKLANSSMENQNQTPTPASTVVK